MEKALQEAAFARFIFFAEQAHVKAVEYHRVFFYQRDLVLR